MKVSFKKMLSNVLNGIAIGIIVALVPGALLNNLVGALVPRFPQLAIVLTMTGIATTLMPVLSAVCVGMLGKLTPIQTTSLALAAMVGAGNVHVTKAGLVVGGTGDVINILLTLLVGYFLINLLGTALQAYTILLLPTLVLLIGGGIGLLTLKPVGMITTALGQVVLSMTTLQPILMGTLVGAGFALLIVSPISTVGIATAIGLNGIASGSANLGITAAGFALAIYGWKANSIGTSLAHFLGSPKMQMANMLAKPKIMLPMALNAGILGGIGAAFGIVGTPMSAGFGFSGLIGPLAAIAGMKSVSAVGIIEVTVLFFVLPIVLGLLSNYLFTTRLHYQDSADYALHYE